MGMEIVYVSIISGFFTLIGLIVYQRGTISTWAMKMDYKKQEFDHKENLAKIRGQDKKDLTLLKHSEKPGFNLNQVGEIVENVKELVEDTTDNDNPLVRLLGSDFIQGIIKKLPSLSKKNETETKEEWAS